MNVLNSNFNILYLIFKHIKLLTLFVIFSKFKLKTEIQQNPKAMPLQLQKHWHYKNLNLKFQLPYSNTQHLELVYTAELFTAPS